MKRRTIGIALAVPAMAVLLMGAKGCGTTTVNTGSGIAAVPATAEPNGVATNGPRVPRIPMSWRNDSPNKTDIGNHCAVVRWAIGHPRDAAEINTYIAIACTKRPTASTMVMGLQRRQAGAKWHTEASAIYHHVPGPFPNGTPYPVVAPCKHTGTYRLLGVFKVVPHTDHRVVELVSGPVYVVCPPAGG